MKIMTHTATWISLLLSGALHAAALSTPKLSSVDNFRDIAGITETYSTRQGGTLRSGVFYRANKIVPNAADRATLSTLGIRDVYDLRTVDEMRKNPDRLPEGMRWTHIDILGNFSSASNAASIPKEMYTVPLVKYLMHKTYSDFVDIADIRSQYGVLFNALAHSEGAAIFHCTDGKDRTGWTAAMLLHIAGVDDATIMENYLATNDYVRERVAVEAALAKATDQIPDEAIYTAAHLVEADYIQSGLDAVASQYGDIDTYLRDGLGLSQETLYVLRGKMVHYDQLPGQTALHGNAAQGAALLNALQDSPLAGSYTAYNYYLQSAIDASTLGGMESRVGGQIHADAASYLLRSGARLEQALLPNRDSQLLADGAGRLWLSGLADYLGTDGSARAASSSEHTAGLLLGYTRRVDAQLSGYGAIGYSHGSIGSAGAEAKTRTDLLGLGARYAFTDLAQGPFVSADLLAGRVDYRSDRALYNGLGRATADADGYLVDGALRVGYLRPFTFGSVEAALGTRLTHLRLDALKERDSELALAVDKFSANRASGLASLNVAFTPLTLGDGQFTPALSLSYEHSFSNPLIRSHGRLYDYDVWQNAAYSGRDSLALGALFGFTRGPFNLTFGSQAEIISGGDSHGFSGNMNVAYLF